MKFNFNALEATSGRFSSSKPNQSNTPQEAWDDLDLLRSMLTTGTDVLCRECLVWSGPKDPDRHGANCTQRVTPQPQVDLTARMGL